MDENTQVVTAIIGSAAGIVAVLGVMIRSMNRRIDDLGTGLGKRIDDLGIGLGKRIDDLRGELNARLDETNRRLGRVETRVDDMGRDIAELRDRIGKLEGTVATFISGQDRSAAA